MDSPRLAVDGRCDARVSCGDETSEVRGTRSECRVLGSSRAVAVTDVGRVRVCGSTAFANRCVAIARCKAHSALYLRLDRQPGIDLVAGVRRMADLFRISPLIKWQTVLKKSKRTSNTFFSVKNLKNRVNDFFFFFENDRRASNHVAGVSPRESAFSLSACFLSPVVRSRISHGSFNTCTRAASRVRRGAHARDASSAACPALIFSSIPSSRASESSNASMLRTYSGTGAWSSR